MRPDTFRRSWPSIAVLALFFLTLAIYHSAQAQEALPQNLQVGTRVAPPFVMKTDDGGWEGISIDLTEFIAERLGRGITWHETSLVGMIDDVENGRLDMSVAAMTITSERSQRVNFSHPYYRTGLGVAVADQPWSGLHATWRAVTSNEFLLTICVMSTLAFIAGALIWRVERIRNSEDFARDPVRGLGSGFWWAAVTMTTVGYGDKAPVTAIGRIIAMGWMFVALILTGVFTAQLTANLSAQGKILGVKGTGDLVEESVGVIRDSQGANTMRDLGSNIVEYNDVTSGLDALQREEIKAFVHDLPLLVWSSRGRSDIRLTDLVLELWDYGIVVPRGSPILEDLNIYLLELLESEDWKIMQRRYIGIGTGQRL